MREGGRGASPTPPAGAHRGAGAEGVGHEGAVEQAGRGRYSASPRQADASDGLGVALRAAVGVRRVRGVVDATGWFLAAGALAVPAVTFLVAAPSLGRTARLRRQIAADVAAHKDMADGTGRAALGRHINRQVNALLAEEEPRTLRESRSHRRAWQWYTWALSLFFIAAPLSVAVTGFSPLVPQSGWLGDVIVRLTALAILFGFLLTFKGNRTYAARKRRLADEALDLPAEP